MSRCASGEDAPARTNGVLVKRLVSLDLRTRGENLVGEQTLRDKTADDLRGAGSGLAGHRVDRVLLRSK